MARRPLLRNIANSALGCLDELDKAENQRPTAAATLRRRRRPAGSCAGVHCECRQSPRREGPRHDCEYDNVEFRAREWRCVTDAGEAEYAVSVRVFRRTTGRGRAAPIMGGTVVAADLEGSPAWVGGTGGKATGRNGHRNALQDKGKDQDRGGKLPSPRSPHLPQHRHPSRAGLTDAALTCEVRHAQYVQFEAGFDVTSGLGLV